MEGNVLSGECGEVPTQLGNVLNNACPEASSVVGNILAPCDCEESETVPDPIIDLESDLGVTYAAPLGAPPGGFPIEDPAPSGYFIGDRVDVRVYPYKVVGGVRFYSAYLELTNTLSADSLSIIWDWVPVAGADGYRLLQSYNLGGFGVFFDVTSGNQMLDDGAAWSGGSTVTPTAANQIPLWEDQTANNNDRSQATPASMPSLLAAQLNGYPALHFVGGGLGGGLSELPALYTFHGVFSLPAIVANRRIFDTATLPLLGISAAGKWFAQTTGANIISAGGASIGYHHFTLIMAGSGNTSELYIDGVLVASGNLGDQTLFPGQGLSIPNELGTTNIDWVRFKMFNVAFTEAQRIAVEANSETKYAL